jgi:hypothetical protein
MCQPDPRSAQNADADHGPLRQIGHTGAKPCLEHPIKSVLETIHGVEVRASGLHGLGLFTTRDRAAGEVLTMLDGQCVPHNDDMELLATYEWNAVSATEIQLRPMWTLYGYINHARPANLTVRLTGALLCARVPVAAGTELTLDYTEHGFPQIYLDDPRGGYLR